MPNLMEMLLKNFLQTCDSGGSREGAWGSAPLFFDQTEARRAEKGFLETPPPLYLRVWMTGLHRCPKDVRETY